MLELGNILNTGYGANIADATPHGISDVPEPTASSKIGDDDAAVAVIRNSLHAETAGALQDEFNTDGELPPSHTTKDIMTAVREKMAEFKQLVEELANGRYSAGKMSRDMEAQAEEIRGTAEDTGYGVYSDVGKLVAKLREEIEAINSFDGFLLGVHNRIDEISEPVEFRLEQVLDVERHMAELHATLELSRFCLARVTAEALKVARCQANLEPETVLQLLKG